MAKFSREELHQRLAFDFQVAMAMRHPIMQISAHREAKEAKADKNGILITAEAKEAKHYRVVYWIRTLAGQARYHDETIVHIDLLANGNYPFSDPSCWVISKPIPWSPHFKEGAPICIGRAWSDAKGKMLLGHLLIHIAKLLNFDEVARGGGYVGWNGKATRFWEEKLKHKPITPDLVYPTLPAEITHRVSQGGIPRSLFRPKGNKRAETEPPREGLFRPKGDYGKHEDRSR